MRAVAAAVRTSDGVIHFMPAPHRHHHTVHALNAKRETNLLVAEGEQGFVMDDGTFANRIDAAKHAIESGQIKSLAHPPNLYSEDLW